MKRNALLQLAPAILAAALSCARPFQARANPRLGPELAATIGNGQKEKANGLNKLGMNLFEADRLDEAFEAFNQALELYRQENDPAGEANALSNISLVHLRRKEWLKGRECQEQALRFFQSHGDRAREGESLARIAFTFDGEGNREAAVTYYRRAISLLQSGTDHRLEAAAALAVGNDLLAMGKNQELVELLPSVLPVYRNSGNRPGEAAALELLGIASEKLVRDQDALAYYEQSLSAWASAGDGSRQAGVLRVMAGIELRLGNYEKALRDYNEAISIWRALNNKSEECRLQRSIGDFYTSLGDFRRGLAYYNQALLLSQSIDDPAGKAALLYDLGHLHALQGSDAQALDFFSQSLTMWHGLGKADKEAQTLAMMGQECEWVGNHQRGADYLNRSLPLWRKAAHVVGEIDALSRLDMVYATMIAQHTPLLSGVDILDQLSNTIRRVAEINDPQVKALVFGRVGLAHTILGNLDMAVEYHRQALALFQDSRDRNGTAIAFFNIGLALESKGQLREALECYQESMNIREKIRSSVHLDDVKSGLSALSSGDYAHAATLLIGTGDTARSFDLTERARARTLLDQLANFQPKGKREPRGDLLREEWSLRAEIESMETTLKRSRTEAAFDPAAVREIQSRLPLKRNEYEDLLTRLKLADPEYASFRTVAPLTLHDVQGLIGKDTTLISYFVTDRMTLAFVITGDSFRALALGASAADLKNKIDWFRRFASKSESQAGTMKELYEQLISPLEQYIKTPRVGVIPHGVLNYLPFAALTNGSRYLGERYSIFYLPSASALRFLRQSRTQPGNHLLAVAQSRANGLPFLRHANEESAGVAALFHTKAFGSGEISRAEFLRMAPRYRILHIAAHGELDPANPLFSRIWLAPKEGDGGALAVHEVYDLELPRTDLVVLSACETQLGARSNGDDIVGLNRAFLYAGASSVIASLWTVDDQATAALMRSFYTHLKRGMGKAEALQAAQSSTREKYAHPYYWAGFVLTGDPDLKTNR